MANVAHLTLRVQGSGLPVDQLGATDFSEDAQDGPYIPGQLKVVSIEDVIIQVQPTVCSIVHHRNPTKTGFDQLVNAAAALRDLLGLNQVSNAKFTSHGHQAMTDPEIQKSREAVHKHLAALDPTILSSGALRLDYQVAEPAPATRSIRIEEVGHSGTHQGMIVVELTIEQPIDRKQSFKKFIELVEHVGYSGFEEDAGRRISDD